MAIIYSDVMQQFNAHKEVQNIEVDGEVLTSRGLAKIEPADIVIGTKIFLAPVIVRGIMKDLRIFNTQWDTNVTGTIEWQMGLYTTDYKEINVPDSNECFIRDGTEAQVDHSLLGTDVLFSKPSPSSINTSIEVRAYNLANPPAPFSDRHYVIGLEITANPATVAVGTQWVSVLGAFTYSQGDF